MRFALTAVLAWMWCCGAASASTISSSQRPSESSWLNVVAAPGERNDVLIDPGPDALKQVRVHDAAGVTAVEPCVAHDAQTAICPAAAFVHAELRDGDDRLTGTLAVYANVVGGEGNDELRWPRIGRVDGGPGDDVLSGGGVDGGPGNDVLDGHKLIYGARTAGVTIDLPAGVAGEPGEHDRVLPGVVQKVLTGTGPDVIRMAELRVGATTGDGDDTVIAGPAGSNVTAGPGNDTLTGGAGDDSMAGDDGDDRLAGAAGNDTLDGGHGEDTLEGGLGTDRLEGGVGKDRLLARDGRRERVNCSDTLPAGELEDDVAVLDSGDSHNLCERVERAGTPRLELIATVGYSTPRSVLVACPARARGRACSGTVRAQGDRRRRFSVRPGQRARLPVRPRGITGDLAYRVTVDLRSGRTLRAELGTVARP